MPRVVLGNRTGALALTQARTVLAELSEGWPDVSISQRTLQGRSEAADELLRALQGGRVNIAVQSLESLPLTLPDGLSLAAVTKRLEPRLALIARGERSLEALPQGATVGVPTERDRAFVLAAHQALNVAVYEELDDSLTRLSAQELTALVWPSATLLQLGLEGRATALLEPQQVTPAPGQGAVALVVKDDDDLANDLAYTLQHRPSFDRARAERAFARHLSAAPYRVGALASVSADGELRLLGAAASSGGDLVLQAEVTGEASEAEELGRELAQDVLEQLSAHARAR